MADPYNFDEWAEAVLRVLKDKKFAQKLGAAAKEYVRNNFLITRDVLDSLNLLLNII